MVVIGERNFSKSKRRVVVIRSLTGSRLKTPPIFSLTILHYRYLSPTRGCAKPQRRHLSERYATPCRCSARPLSVYRSQEVIS